ncbi:hypothetical protein KDL44_02920 [bacterium]|nr:hypothetical protein [bacterium]
MKRDSIAALLLRTRQLIYPEAGGTSGHPELVDALELNLSTLGYALHTRLRSRISTLDRQSLAALHDFMMSELRSRSGADVQHKVLFRRFPQGVPTNMLAALWKRLLFHFIENPCQQCPFCGSAGTTHVLNPCRHVVCSVCFDGGNYGACPVCETHVDMNSPFFLAVPADLRDLPEEQVAFKLIQLGTDIDDDARMLFSQFCSRRTPLSESDRLDLRTLTAYFGEDCPALLPDEFPLRENMAIVVGTLLRMLDSEDARSKLTACMRSATDVLRVIAVYSGADASLERTTVTRQAVPGNSAGRQQGLLQKLLSTARTTPPRALNMRIARFEVAGLPRKLRRLFLARLESMDPESIREDMLRHRSYWVWLGEFLHPGEYAGRYPQTYEAFRLVRKRDSTGAVVARHRSFRSRLESAFDHSSARGALEILKRRPGEFARHYARLLALCGDDGEQLAVAIGEFRAALPEMATPVLLTLLGYLPVRLRTDVPRLFHPKANLSVAFFQPEHRAALPAESVRQSVEAIRLELLGRLGHSSTHDTVLIDDAMTDIIMPTSERSHSSSGINLPRGSSLQLDSGRWLRLFLHWCEPQATPERRQTRTDLDLSVGFYNEYWSPVGVCSYYNLSLGLHNGLPLARSSGDLQSANWPDGSTEFVDVDLENARQCGWRYAVMVINSYAGLPFTELERAFAGFMLRNDEFGSHFDPRTVVSRFSLDGSNGMFMPLLLDLTRMRMLWMDTYSRGQLAFNNVANSNKAITAICPAFQEYYGSGLRCSVRDLMLIRAAAARRVILRGSSIRVIDRHAGEAPAEFLQRLIAEEGARTVAELEPELQGNILATLLHGDLELPAGSSSYSLYPGSLAANVSLADLIS